MIKINGNEIESFVFNGGECHVKIPDWTMYAQTVSMTAWLYNSDDIMKLLLIVNALQQRRQDIKINLTIPYFPYARQDRVCNPGEAHSILTMAQLIEVMRVNKLIIYDPHSEITPALLRVHVRELNVITRKDILKKAVQFMHPNWWILVSPDDGAEKETRLIAGETGYASVYCTKVRDTLTGNIVGTEVPAVLADGKYLIIDDICDGGRTFIEIAKKFIAQGVPKENLNLYVTHGIFSKGFFPLVPYFNHIYCYHKFPGVPDVDFVTVLNEQEKWHEF